MPSKRTTYRKKRKSTSSKVIDIKKKRKKNFKNFLIIILFITLILYIALFTPIFNITKIEVVGNEKFTSEQIINLSGIPYGENIFKVRYFEVKDNIYKNQYIKYAKISRRYPGTVRITVEERKPAAYLEYMGMYLIIDNEGIVLDKVKNIKEINIPVILGINLNKYTLGKTPILNDEEVDKFNIAIECINAGINNGVNNIISKIDINDINYIIAYTYDNKYQINFIDGSEIDYKYKFLARILGEEDEKNAEYIIDFTSPSRPVVKPKY